VRDVEQIVDALVRQTEALHCLLCGQADAMPEYLHARDIKDHVLSPVVFAPRTRGH
jgi:hypothetical protein